MNQKVFGIGILVVLVGALLITGVAHQRDAGRQFSSLSELESFLDSHTDASYNAYGRETATLEADSGKATGGTASAQAAPAADPSYSTTNVQVAGIDEPDFVKNDGEYIYLAREGTLSIIHAAGSESRIVSTIKLNASVYNILVRDDQLIVFGTEYYAPCIDCAQPLTEEKPAIAEESFAREIMPYYESPQSFVTIYDISDRTAPEVESSFVYEGSYRDARLMGTYVYLIANQELIRESEDVTLPRLGPRGEQTTIAARDITYFPMPDYGYQLTTIVAFNLENDGENPTHESFLTGYSHTVYVSENAVYLASPVYIPYDTYTTRVLEEVYLPSLPADVRDDAEEALDENAIYEAEAEVLNIVARYYNELSSEEKASFESELADRMNEFDADWQADMQKTLIHKIAINEDTIDYVAYGEVPGQLLNQFSMDEHEGYLRVATSTQFWFGGLGIAASVPRAAEVMGAVEDTTQPEMETPEMDGFDNEMPEDAPESVPDDSTQRQEIPQRVPIPEAQRQESTNAVYILDSDLNIVGTLDDLAEGERIYSARFMGDRLYLVTFKQIDPLFVVDLSNPQNPELLGELKIPGYSTYLHPFDETTIIGIGQDTDGTIEENGEDAAIPAGLKIALFDVSDPSSPREIDHFIVGDRGTYSDALYDHKAFLLDQERGLLILPVSIQERIGHKVQGENEGFWYPTRTVFQGVYVFEISKESGIEVKGMIDHWTADDHAALEKARASNDEYFYPPYEAAVQRSLYIGDSLYTISMRTLKANDINTLNEQVALDLPYQTYMYEKTDVGGTGGSSFSGAENAERVDPVSGY